MNDRAPHGGEAQEGVLGGMQGDPTEAPGCDDPEHDLCWELRGRLHAVLQELDLRPIDLDVVKTLLEGAVEAIEAVA